MAPKNRIKGQEVTIIVSLDGEIREEISEITKFNEEDVFEIISKGYLGGLSEEKDMVFKGTKGSMDLDISSQKLLAFRQLVREKAQHIKPDLVFTISIVLSFSNGDTPTINYRNCAFGGFPMDISDRVQYVKCTINFECSGGDARLS